ncbi:MAG TPA: TlpA disulfide reductase family protein [Bryobacteraceae bacterium]|nr:TlpA disulfide reductase family protein [Bryobacteraceae bacterium]
MGWFDRSTTLQAGAQAPSFKLPALSGGSTASGDLLAGGAVVLAFFKVSCPVCQMTFPYLERLHKAGLRVVGVSQDKAGATESFVRQFGITFPILLDDPKGYPASNAFGISSVPTLFTIEPDARISAVSEGFARRDLDALGERVGTKPFGPADRVPEFRPG